MVLKPGFRPKGRALGIKEKSENFNSLRPILFELCKKTSGGGAKLTPPPAGMGFKTKVYEGILLVVTVLKLTK